MPRRLPFDECAVVDRSIRCVVRVADNAQDPRLANCRDSIVDLAKTLTCAAYRVTREEYDALCMSRLGVVPQCQPCDPRLCGSSRADFERFSNEVSCLNTAATTLSKEVDELFQTIYAMKCGDTEPIP